MKSVHYLELLEKETLLFTEPMREVPARVENSSAIHAQLGSAIELTRHYMTYGQMKVKRRRRTPQQAVGHARRRRIKMVLYRADPFLSRTRMPFIPDASIGVLR